MLAAWSGIRPLVTNPDSKDTQSLSRNHVVTVSDSGLITIAGTGSSLNCSCAGLPQAGACKDPVPWKFFSPYKQKGLCQWQQDWPGAGLARMMCCIMHRYVCSG